MHWTKSVEFLTKERVKVDKIHNRTGKVMWTIEVMKYPKLEPVE